MHILERFRTRSSALRVAHALLCAIFLLNLLAHFAHRHDASLSASCERLTCAHCCAFTGMADVPKSPEPGRAPMVACGVAFAPTESRIVQEPRSSHLARGPPSIHPTVSTALS